MGAEQYGDRYWCIKVPRTVSPDGEIYAMADQVVVAQTGALLLMQESQALNLVLAPGQWIVCFAASLIDGHAVAVERWEGEVVR